MAHQAASPHDPTFAGVRVLVTGGSRGIGAAICRAVAGRGAAVVVNYYGHFAEAFALLHELGAEHRAFQADVGDETEVAAMFGEVARSLGGLDILINNAGYDSTFAALDLPMAEWDKVLNTNLRGAFLCAREAGRLMQRQGTGGVIVNISSIHESVPRLGLTHYCVSKAGLAMLTRALALEWAEYGIRVVGLAPGAIETDMNRAEIAAFGRHKFEEWIPLHRLGQVEDVAAAALFLASEAASYVTGATLQLDGAYALNVIHYDPRRHP